MARTWITANDLSDPMHPDAGYAIEVASWVLYRLTGEKYPGIVPTTEWYGLENTTCSSGCLYPHEAMNRSHHHYYFPVCTNTSPRQLRLRHVPVRSITSVSVGGSALAASAYYVVNSAYLIRRDVCGWELRQGVEVAYSYGQNPPTAGRRAAAKLADELILAFNQSDACRLPDRVTSISRQGVSMTVLDPQDFLKDGRTGLYEVDLFIQAANPAGARKRPKVFSPDKPRGEHRI